MSKIRISAVSYANTYPFLLGLENYMQGDDFEISRDVPSECATKLISQKVDLGLIPVASIPKIKNPLIISDYCIGSQGPVKTVLLMSKVPLQKIQKIHLDRESNTSVNLIKVLERELWKMNWQYALLPSDYNTNSEIESMVLIGDKTQKTQDFNYQYDLSEAWFQLTGKPFVFAVWVANKKLPDEFVHRFNNALKAGLSRIPEAIAKYNVGHNYNLLTYLEENISYSFDVAKQEALKLFLKYIENN